MIGKWTRKKERMKEQKTKQETETVEGQKKQQKKETETEISVEEYTELFFSGEEDVQLPMTTEMFNLAAEYKRLMFFYEAGIDQIVAKLQILNKEFQLNNDRNPIENIQYRVKSIESIQKKMEKMGVPLTRQNIVNCLHDVAGVRIICPFIKDVYQMGKMLLEQDDITYVKMKDYIREPKANGYRSLHLIVTVNVFFSNYKAKVPVELQLRTIAMNCWASLEHQLRYKKDFPTSEERHKELKICADMMASADERMQRLADELPGF
ncbi:MAG: GTP pyrophosphokinase family protein [Lachnospiraceae bacterium]|nr:GTP pyrophosphokinase family protein [Lachnospiraceae bacterium]